VQPNVDCILKQIKVIAQKKCKLIRMTDCELPMVYLKIYSPIVSKNIKLLSFLELNKEY